MKAWLPFLAFLWPSALPAIELGKVIWEFKTGGAVYASATVAPNGTIFLGTNGNKLYSLTPGESAASVNWAFVTDDWVDTSAAIGPDGTVYIGTYDSTLYAINPATGVKKWEFKAGEDEGMLGLIMASPAIAADGSVIVATTAGMVHGVSKEGAQLWAFEADEEIRSSPAIDSSGNIYFGTHGGVFYSLTSAGQKRWTFSVDGAGATASRIRSSPAIDRDGHVYFGAGNGFLYSLTSAGALRWKFATSEAVDTSPAIGEENRVYFASRGGSYHCLSQAGQELWSKFFGDVFYSSPAIDEQGYTYLAYFVGNNQSKVVCMTPDGDEAWATPLNTVIDASPTLSPDGILYISGFNGALYALSAGRPLNYDAPWPRFRKDLRSRGRVIDGAVPQIVSAPRPLALIRQGRSSLQLVTGNPGQDVILWRKNGASVGAGSTLPLAGHENAVALYDALVSNEFGETRVPSTFLALLDQHSVQVSASDRRLSASYIVPSRGAWEVATSEDLLTWTTNGVAIDLATLSPSTRMLKASASGGGLRFLRLQLGQ